MTNGNWVCFECRTSQRRSIWKWATFYFPRLLGDASSGGVRCPKCKEPCRFLGYRIAIPPNRDIEGWRQLGEFVNERRDVTRDESSRRKARKKHEIEQRIEELRRRPANKERARLIKELRAELDRLASE